MDIMSSVNSLAGHVGHPVNALGHADHLATGQPGHSVGPTTTGHGETVNLGPSDGSLSVALTSASVTDPLPVRVHQHMTKNLPVTNTRGVLDEEFFDFKFNLLLGETKSTSFKKFTEKLSFAEKKTKFFAEKEKFFIEYSSAQNISSSSIPRQRIFISSSSIC